MSNPLRQKKTPGREEGTRPGIPLPLLRAHASRCIRLPMMAAARSLNLSNTVAIAVYEVLRQLDYPQLSREEVIKGKDWLDRG